MTISFPDHCVPDALTETEAQLIYQSQLEFEIASDRISPPRLR